ncbi:MAG: hypothetical protein AB4062_09585 [Crocosphaera sp.]
MQTLFITPVPKVLRDGSEDYPLFELAQITVRLAIALHSSDRQSEKIYYPFG